MWWHKDNWDEGKQNAKQNLRNESKIKCKLETDRENSDEMINQNSCASWRMRTKWTRVRKVTFSENSSKILLINYSNKMIQLILAVTAVRKWLASANHLHFLRSWLEVLSLELESLYSYTITITTKAGVNKWNRRHEWMCIPTPTVLSCPVVSREKRQK